MENVILSSICAVMRNEKPSLPIAVFYPIGGFEVKVGCQPHQIHPKSLDAVDLALQMGCKATQPNSTPYFIYVFVIY